MPVRTQIQFWVTFLAILPSGVQNTLADGPELNAIPTKDVVDCNELHLMTGVELQSFKSTFIFDHRNRGPVWPACRSLDEQIEYVNQVSPPKILDSESSETPGAFIGNASLSKFLTARKTEKTNRNKTGFRVNEEKDQLHIFFNDQRIATYLKDHPVLTRRALVNVMSLRGTQVTRNFPPQKPEDVDSGYRGEGGIIHPNMHPGIWLGFGDVNGNDYWRLKSKVKYRGLLRPFQGGQNSASFTVENSFLSQNEKNVVCDEVTRYTFRVVPAGLMIRIDCSYSSDQNDFYFGDQEESGLAVRVASGIRIKGGNGTILNDRGEKNGNQIWGKEARWFDYFGSIKGRQVGIMVASSPDNPRPSWLHARDYGLVATNPFPKQPRERREPYIKTIVKKGQPFTLSYALLVHDDPLTAKFDRQSAAAFLIESMDKKQGQTE